MPVDAGIDDYVSGALEYLGSQGHTVMDKLLQ